MLVAALALLPAGCDETVTEPEEGEMTYGALIMSYEADVGSAESGEITPEEGGELSATGLDGVTYTLDVCPGAIESSTVVTITPLKELSICSMDSVHVDTSDCIVGALFEPDGLEFGSPAVLTITFPESGLDCTLDEYFCVVSIDSSSAFYEMLPTVIDYGVPSLTCTLTHFSGYGTHDPDYDFLKKMIEDYSTYGQDFPGDDILGKLMSLADRAAAMGWTDLRDLAWQGAYPILDHLAGEAIDAAAADPGESTLAVLLHYLDPAQAMGFADIEGRLAQAINDLVVAVATRGHQLCQSGDKEAGSALLGEALDWAAAGLVLDIATEEMIEDWLLECSGYEVILTADKPFVNTAAVRADMLDDALLTLTVTVTDAFGDPIEGCSVTIKWDGSGTWSGQTDSGGNFGVMLSGSQLGYGPHACPPHSFDVTFYAEASSGGETYRSDDLPIAIRDIRITSNVNYSFEYSCSEGENSQVESCLVTGAGTGCLGLCDGTLTRAYSKTVNDAWNCTAIDQLEIHHCSFAPTFVYEQISGTSLSVAVVNYVDQAFCYMLEDVIVRTCEATGECTTGEADLYSYLPSYALPFLCDVFHVGIIRVPNDGTGNIFYLWQDSGGGSNDSWTAELSIMMTVAF